MIHYLVKGNEIEMIIQIVEWMLFIFLETYWLYGEKQKMYLYELWMDK